MIDTYRHCDTVSMSASQDATEDTMDHYTLKEKITDALGAITILVGFAIAYAMVVQVQP